MAVSQEAAQNAAADEQRNGRLYLLGLAVSVIGDYAMSLVAGIWVKSLTGSSSRAALVSVCIYAPSLVGPVGGLVADRVRRRRLLIGLNLVSAALILPLLAVNGRDRVWIIFAVMAWYGVHLVLAGPAESALFAVMLSSDVRQRLNGWNLGLQEAGRLIAPLVGAGLFALSGGGVVTMVDAVSFLVAAATMSRIRLREPKPRRARSHIRGELIAGFRHIGHDQHLRRVLVAASVVMGSSAVLVAAQYDLVQAVGKRPTFLGVLTAALGAGSIVASLLSGFLLRRLNESWLLLLGMLNFAVGNMLRAIGTLAPAIVGSVVLGFALPWVFLALLNLSQRATPLQLQGRVSAAVTLLFFGPQAPLQALGAFAIREFTFRQLYTSCVAVTLVTIVMYGYAEQRARNALRRKHQPA